MSAPGPPWSLHGTWLVALTPPGADGVPPPAPLRPLPGPGLLIAGRYERSPVGPHLELATARPARLGAHVGMVVTTMVVDSEASRDGGHTNWSFPKEVGRLRWVEDAGSVEVVWEEAGLRIRSRSAGPALPLVVPARALQPGGEATALVPVRVAGGARACRLDVDVAERAGRSAGLASLAGRRVGVEVGRLRLQVRRAERRATQR